MIDHPRALWNILELHRTGWRHVGNVMGQVGNQMGQVGDPIGQDLTPIGHIFKFEDSDL